MNKNKIFVYYHHYLGFISQKHLKSNLIVEQLQHDQIRLTMPLGNSVQIIVSLATTNVLYEHRVGAARQKIILKSKKLQEPK